MRASIIGPRAVHRQALDVRNRPVSVARARCYSIVVDEHDVINESATTGLRVEVAASCAVRPAVDKGGRFEEFKARGLAGISFPPPHAPQFYLRRICAFCIDRIRPTEFYIGRRWPRPEQ